MQYSTFFVPLGDGGEAQEALNAFLRGRRVLRVETAFAGDGWAFCAEWMEGAPSGGWMPGVRRAVRVDYRETLPPETFAVFARLRDRRREMAEAEGIPPYMVMTDAQLAELAKMAEPCPAALRKIAGFGEARAGKYGARLLEALAACREAAKGAGEAAADPAEAGEGGPPASDIGSRKS